MNYLFQFFPIGLLLWPSAKYQPADLRAVDFSSGGEDALAKGFSETFLDGWFGKNLVARRVSFDDFDGMFLMQQTGEVAFAAADATDQTDYRSSSRGI